MDASIWDEPVDQQLPSKNPDNDDEEDAVLARPAKRPRQALFYADSDDDVEPGMSNGVTVVRPPPAQDLDIEALFDGMDDDEDLSRPLPSMVNEEELTRQAEARYRNKAPPPSLHEILPSSSPSRDTGAQNGDDEGRNGKEGKGKEKKERKRQMKLDENLLLGPTGFPQLIKMTKDFRLKGKGHEATDLNRLLQVYQYWTHQLYPKTTFSDTVDRVEKLCHSRRMNVSLSVWRDEAKGRPPKQSADQDSDNDEDENEDEQGDAMQTDNQNRGLPPSSPPRSSPPAQETTGAGPSRPAPQATAPSGSTNDSAMIDDDEEFWKNLDMGMEGSSSDAPPAPMTSSGANSSMDEDDDMWDIVNEIEKEASSGQVAPVAPVAQGPLPENQPPDDDWDDMYV